MASWAGLTPFCFAIRSDAATSCWFALGSAREARQVRAEVVGAAGLAPVSSPPRAVLGCHSNAELLQYREDLLLGPAADQRYSI